MNDQNVFMGFVTDGQSIFTMAVTREAIASQSLVMATAVTDGQSIFQPTITRVSGLQNTSVPLVTSTAIPLSPGITNFTGAFVEPFTGADGSAPGPLWTTSDKSTGATLQINNNQLLMVGGTIGSNLDYQYLPSDWNVSNFNMRVDITLPSGVTSPHYVHVGFRGSGVQQTTSGLKAVQTTGYLAEIGVGEHYVKLVKLVAGSSSSLSQINLPLFVNGDTVHMRVIGNGTNIRIWTWRNSEPEPSVATINVTDSSYSAGKVMLGHTGGADATGDTVRFDNMIIDAALITDPPIPPPSTARAHWGYDITQDNMTSNFPNARSPAAIATIASIPNAMVSCHVGGFGVYPPEYINNVFDWTGDAQGVPANGLDDAVALMRQMVHPTTGIKMIVLCTSPGWMKASGNTFSMDEAPTDANELQWAQSCAAIAARYTDVVWFSFWNELKGLYNSALNRWNYEKYTRMYNLAWNAIKAVRPDAKIGGPYPVSSSWSSGAPATTLGAPGCTFNGGAVDGRALDVFTYFKNNAIGYDFIACDIWVGNQFGTTMGTTNQLQLDKFIKQMQWLRTNVHATKPIVCVEFYPGNGNGNEDTAGNYVIEVLTRTNAEVSLGEGIWYLQWGESVEVPRPFNYSTGAELPYVTPKLRNYEAGLVPPPAGGGGTVRQVPAQGSLQTVVNASVAGDSIYITGTVTAGGKTLEIINRNNGTNPISIIGNPGSILRGYSGIEGFGSNRGWLFQNLTIEVDPSNYYGEGIYLDGTRFDNGGDGAGIANIRVMGCTIRPTGGSTNRIQRSGISLWGGGNGIEIGNNDIQGCGYNDNGFLGGAGSGISCGHSRTVAGSAPLSNGHSLWIHHNRVRDVTGPGTGSYDRNALILDIYHGWIDSRAPIASNLAGSEPICGIGGYGVGVAGNITCSNNDVTVSPGAAAYKFVAFSEFGGVTGSGNIGGPVVFDSSPGSSPPVGF
jgi:hypothetical protein